MKHTSSPDIVIVGAGISGATLAQEYAQKLHKKVLVIEKRDHIGGNCYDYVNEAGHLVSKYGAHIFHTNDETVWQYVNQFSQWRPYIHRVLAHVEGKLVPIPINRTSVNALFGLNLKTDLEMRSWLAAHQLPHPHPATSEEVALSRVGKELYEKIFKNYTKKQWDKYPSELDPSVLSRIPVRESTDDRYFTDKYQAIPENGYTKVFEKMLEHPNITILLNTDFFVVKDQIKAAEKLFYTGPIDRFFEHKAQLSEKLEWRSLRFEWETLPQDSFQPAAVVNYPNPKDGAFTRIVEYKKIYAQKTSTTTISREYSSAEGEPYYPVPTARNQALFEQYKDKANKLKDIYFVGRLANYKYFNMDEAFKNALDLFASLEKNASI